MRLLKNIIAFSICIYFTLFVNVNAWGPVYNENSKMVLDSRSDYLYLLKSDIEIIRPVQLPNIVGLVTEKEVLTTVGENGIFPISSANIGASGTIIVRLDTGNKKLPLHLSVCRTDPKIGGCIEDFDSSISIEYPSGETASLAVFYHAYKEIPFHYAKSRIYVRYIDKSSGKIAGVTSIVLGAKGS